MRSINRLFKIFLLVIIAVCAASEASAFAPSSYAAASRLASGRWVKVAVNTTGIHFIASSKLREWGFSDPASVRVFGYGGARMSDILERVNYPDDLPLSPAVYTQDGIYFYAVGPVIWAGPDKNGNFTQRNNPWSIAGYYYLSDVEPDALPDIVTEGGSADGRTVATTFIDYTGHEIDKVSPGEMGHLLLGEDFRYTPERTFEFDMPDRVEGSEVWMRCRFFSLVPGTAPTLSFTANGTPLSPAVKLPVNSGENFGDTCSVDKSFIPSGTRLSLGMSLSSSGTVRLANLNSLTINYKRHLRLNGGSLLFNTSDPAVKLDGANGATHVWDVTDPRSVKQMTTKENGGAVTWLSEYTGARRYVAWNEGTTYPSPEMVAVVSNQNIHGEAVPDMIIIPIAAATAQAERLAEMHRNSVDSLRVLVLAPEQVYNEFGSGSADVNAIRHLAKMFWDRGEQDGHSLKYLMLMGRPTYDNRHLTEQLIASGHETLPTWMTDIGHSESLSWSTDDIMAMLEDGSGRVMSSDRLCIAVGRITCRNAAEARTYVDKVIKYVNSPVAGEWKNKMVVVADDQDNGTHLEQAERFIGTMTSTDRGNEFLYHKVYLDAYEEIGGVTVGARDNMFKWLDEGAAWWCYIGHASIDGWSAEGIMRRNDALNNVYFKKLPILFAATCSYSRWDGGMDCGAELLVNNDGGGAIASFCPTRKVYISSNDLFSREMGRAIMTLGPDGRFATIGEIAKNAKNSGSTDPHRLRFVLQGDPALRMPTPVGRVVLTHIGDQPVGSDYQATLMARQQVVLKGYIADSKGEKLSGFNGALHMSIYDAEESIVTLGRGTDDDPGKECVFDQQGLRLYTGRDSVRAGEFAIKVAMPAEIADNFRPAAVNLYAFSDAGVEAMGMSRDVYVYGVDPNAEPDDKAPLIEAVYMNHESFSNGDVVNESPMFFARVSDDIGINLSQAGIGHTLWLCLDDNDTFTDVSDYYIPDGDGSPAGMVCYPLENLSAGNHVLMFRVWDTSGNFTTASVEFYVQPGLPPVIFDVYTDTNPAIEHANFYVRHNRPDAAIEVTIEVFDLMGRRLWSETAKGRSDMFVSSPLTWNLTDRAGRRVARGIYLYRATVSTDGEHHTSAARRIAVAAQ